MKFGCGSDAVQMGYCDDLEQSTAESGETQEKKGCGSSNIYDITL